MQATKKVRSKRASRIFFGRECYKHLEVLLERWGKLDIASSKFGRFAGEYLRLFGIPDIGFQLRALHFRKFIQKNVILTRRLSRALKFLDAGCGLGAYSFYIAEKYPSAKIDACDYDIKYIKTGKEILKELNLENVNIFQKDLLELSRQNEYDLIISIDVLEHIKHDEQAIKNMYAALRTDGILFLHVPKKHLKWRHFERLAPLVRRECYLAKDHVREGYSEYEIVKILENNNFRIKKLKNTFGIVAWLAFEINLLALVLLPLTIAALIFLPMLIILPIDTLIENQIGNCILIIAQK